MILYLHDTPFKRNSELAANKNNIDTIQLVESFLKKNNDIVLTADDGYKSVKNLLPTLDKYGTRLIFFVTTGFIDKKVYPYEVEISRFLENNSNCIYEDKKYIFNNINEKEIFFKRVHNRLKSLSLKSREKFVEQFALVNKYDRKKYQDNVFMSWDEVKNLSKHPLVEIGSHCVSHLFLPTQNINTIYKELKNSKEQLEQKLNYKVTKLSYPYGGNNLKVRLIAKLLGYKKAYGTQNKKSKIMNIARSELKDFV